MSTPDYDGRVRRAHRLARLQTPAKPALLLYACLAEFHSGLYAKLTATPPTDGKASSANFRSELDLASVLHHFPEFLSLLQRNGSDPMGEAARLMAFEGPAAWITVLTEYWGVAGRSAGDGAAFDVDPASGADAWVEFIARAFLQPYAEFLSRHREAPESMGTEVGCPVCGSAPMLAALRGTDGKHNLACSLCLHEWRRGVEQCFHCGARRDAKASRHFLDEMAHVSLETCDSCRTYLPCIDTSKEREAIPEVDDIAAVELQRWAEEHNYRRACANVLGT
jgi:formate dehydrogenase accessory protein FdhE